MSYESLLQVDELGRRYVSGRALILALMRSRKDLDPTLISFKHSSNNDIRRVVRTFPDGDTTVFDYERESLIETRRGLLRKMYQHTASHPTFLSREIKKISRPSIKHTKEDSEIKIYT